MQMLHDTKIKWPEMQNFTVILLTFVLATGFTAFYCLRSQSSFLRNPKHASSSEILYNGCNVFDGNWVWDNLSKPLYEEWDCTYIHKYTACQTSGRPDLSFKYWRWQPKGCNLPRFDPLKLIEVLRGKRLMFVGDSVQRNQFDSMVCLVQGAIQDEKKSYLKVPPSLTMFTMEEFNASIEFYWAPFLVSSTSDDADNHSGKVKLVNLDSISSHGEAWKSADVLIFNSHVWWSGHPSLSCLYQGEMKLYSSIEAYEIALKTWSNWVEKNINFHRQQVFFMTMSPTHWGQTGEPGSIGNCFNETSPNFTSYWGQSIDFLMMKIAEDVLHHIKGNAGLLSITRLSEYRIDAHTSYYGKYKTKRQNGEIIGNSKRYGDCLHWCLPGVPDTWNEILYAFLLNSYPLKNF